MKCNLGELRRLMVASLVLAGAGALAGVAGAVDPSPPANTSPPTISGTPRQGRTLTVDVGGWDGTQPVAFTFEWLRCDTAGVTCKTISGVTGSTYVPAAPDVDRRLRVIVFASNVAGASSFLSGATEVVAAGQAPTPAEPTATDGQGKVRMCHKGRQTITVGKSALRGHLRHGDTVGPCAGTGDANRVGKEKGKRKGQGKAKGKGKGGRR